MGKQNEPLGCFGPAFIWVLTDQTLIKMIYYTHTTIFGSLDEKVAEAILWELFVNSEPVTSVNMPNDRITGTHQGFGYIEFMIEEDADYAIKIMNMIKFNKASANKKQMDVGANLFVDNLAAEAAEVDEKLLFDTFSAFGVILQASDAALEAMNGQFLCNRPITCSYAFKKDTKGERHGTAAERLLASQNPMSRDLGFLIIWV
uniref:RRM domain-containing protein n=1 Tax=Meloidogyne floridensis TaxID=298350 RepID=A0A915NTY1_9BILA